MTKLRNDHGHPGPSDGEEADVMGGEFAASRSPFQAALIAAGRADSLPSTRRDKLTRALGVVGGLPLDPLAPSGLGTGSGIATTAKVGLLETVGAKVVGALAIAGAAVWGGWQLTPAVTSGLDGNASVEQTSGASAQAKQELVAPPVSPEPPALGTPASRAALPSDQVGASTPAKGVKGRSRTQPSDSLSAELALIDSARAALLRGEPGAALRTLHTYRNQFPRGALQAEATVQRVEALIATGDRPAAAKIGGAFLKRYPNSPYSRRIASLLGVSR